MFLNNGKRAKQLTLSILVLLLTVSIMLALPPTITKATMVEKGVNSKTDEGAIEWNQTYGRANNEWAWCVEQTSDGGYIITGETRSFGPGDYDVWLIKTDANGTEEWNQTYGGTGHDHGWCGKQTSDGGYIVTGYTRDYGAGVWLIKTYANGTEEWNQTYGGTGNHEGYSVEQTSDGGYIITGYTQPAGNADVWLIKTDGNGTEEWNQTYGREFLDGGYHVEQTSDGGYIITGWAGDDVWLIKTNTYGDAVWNLTYGKTGYDDYGFCVEQTSDGGYIITGYTTSFGVGSQDVWLIKTDEYGNPEWNKTYGSTNYDGGFCVEQTTDGGYIITGYFSIDSYDCDAWLIKTDANGDEVWSQTYGGTDYDEGMWVEQTTDGGYIITGYTQSYGVASSRDFWLIKVFPDVPFIDHPADLVYEEDSTGHNITWHPRDPINPHMFNVTLNNTLVNSSSWSGGDITVDLDVLDLSVGTYIFICTVNDTIGYSVNDRVTVLVIAAQEGEEEDEGFSWLWLTVGIAVGLAAGIGVTVLYFKKK